MSASEGGDGGKPRRMTKGKLAERLQMRGQIHKAYKVMLKLIDPKYYKDDQKIPMSLIKKAKGLVFVTVVRAGFLFSGSVGAGLIICRLPNGEWSGPSSLGVGGVGFGAQIGANSTDSVIVLNTDAAVKAFSGKGNIKLGGNLSIAVGPVGREGDASVTKGSLKESQVTACYSYSHSRGLFAGVSLQGTVLLARADDNKHFYGYRASPGYILAGNAIPPQNDDLDLLYECLTRVTGYGLNHVSNDVNPFSLVNEETYVRQPNRQTFSKNGDEDDDDDEFEVDSGRGEEGLVASPTPVPPNANIDSPYELNNVEYGWYCALKERMEQLRMLNKHDAFMSFHLAQYAIAAKGDVEKAIKRMTSVLAYKANKRLADVSLNEAWNLASPGLFLPAGYDVDGRPLVVLDISKFVAKDFSTKENISKLLRWLLNIFNSTITDLTDFRKGITLIIQLQKLKKTNYSLKLLRNLKVKKLLTIAKDGFPLQIERVVLLNADPSKVNSSVINGAGRLFIPKSVRRIIEFYDKKSIFKLVEPGQLPREVGGKYVESRSLDDWRVERKRRYQETCSMLYDSIMEREHKL